MERVCARFFRNLSFFSEGRVRVVDAGVVASLATLIKSTAEEVRDDCVVALVTYARDEVVLARMVADGLVPALVFASASPKVSRRPCRSV